MFKRSRGIALNHQLETELIDLINSGELKENDKLPSERELCEQYNVSRTTARQAIGELERKEYVYKVHGKGTFISPKVYKQQLLKFYSFTEEMKKLGLLSIEATEDFFKSIDMPTSLKELVPSIKIGDLEDMADRCSNISGGHIGSCKILDREDMLSIYKMAFDR